MDKQPLLNTYVNNVTMLEAIAAIERMIADGLREKISSYVDEGYVSYHLIRGRKRQCDAYNEAIDKYKYESKYMIFIRFKQSSERR